MLIRFHVTDYFRDCGFRVLEATDAARALELLQAEPSIDIVFTDITLPGDLDGVGLAQWIHKHRPTLPVVLTSGKVSEATHKYKNIPFFAKPCDYAEVIAHIRALLEKT